MTARLLAVGLLALLLGCAHGGEPDIATLASNSDQVIWEAGQKAFEKKQWENARQYFRRIIDGFPQSEFVPAARLGLGDSYFKEGGASGYILAISAYREFLTFYPSHPRSDYAQFQVAESYFEQRNGPDRDQTATRNALDEYDRLLDVYPNSSFVEQARARITTCRQSLARAEFLAGYFYQRTREACRAAITRYEGILNEFPDYARLDEVLFRLAECLGEIGRAPEAQPHLARLLSDFPQSDYVPQAKELMADLAARPAAPPGPEPSPGSSPAPGGTAPPSVAPAAKPSPPPPPPPPAS